MIEVKNLTKSYGNHLAVSDVSFTIENGKIYGFLGPNGAGKSTTMNIMTGCLAATSGQVLVDGHDIFEDALEAKKRIGYLPELPPLYQDMTPEEYLRFVGEMKGLRGEELRGQVEKVMQVTMVTDVCHRLIRQLSKGYRQRVGVAQALLGHPDVIILDEPTVGLDPKQIIEIRDLIRELGKDHTVLLSSHILSEVRAICDVIIIISQGKLVAIDTPENLEKLFSGDTTLELVVKGSAEEVEKIVETVPEVKKLTCEELGDGRVKASIVSAGGADLSEQMFAAFAGARLPIVSMTTAAASLEDVFLELTEGEQNPVPESEPESEQRPEPETEEGGESK